MEKMRQARKKVVPDLNRETGYFDKALKRMNDMGLKIGQKRAPAFNDEWNPAQIKHKQDTELLVSGHWVIRGDTFKFHFLGPGPEEIQCLIKFFTENISTKASIRQLTDEDMQVTTVLA